MAILFSFLAGFFVLWLIAEIYIQIQLFKLIRECLDEIKEIDN